jgi:hypothetical protein
MLSGSWPVVREQCTPGKHAKRGAWRLPVCFFRSCRDAEGVAGGAHRKSGVKSAPTSKFPARWSHTNSSVRYHYKPLVLPRIGECKWKILRLARYTGKYLSASVCAGKRVINAETTLSHCTMLLTLWRAFEIQERSAPRRAWQKYPE